MQTWTWSADNCSISKDELTELKERWGKGPWNDEPDKAVWVDERTSLDCMIHRHISGALCGYVGVPKEHPFYGCNDFGEIGDAVIMDINYSEGCNDSGSPAFGICHVPQPGRPKDVWWLGFDCSHAPRDYVPGWAANLREMGHDDLANMGTYKTFETVTDMVHLLAHQLAVIGSTA